MRSSEALGFWHSPGLAVGRWLLTGAIVAGPLALVGWLASRPDEPRLVVESLVNIDDFPSSPTSWPEGDPILIECWGGPDERSRSRVLAGVRLKVDALAGPFRDDAVRSERTDWMAAIWKLREEYDPLTDITLRVPATGIRYSWSATDALPRRRAGRVEHFEEVFPAAELPEVDTFEARQTDLMDALEAFDTVSPDARRAWRAAAMTAETARDERDRAADARFRAWDQMTLRNALRYAVQKDAINACAR